MILPISISKGTTVLIAGAGGGFDFLCGLPVASVLRNSGCKVVYANYSFTNLNNIQECKRISDVLINISANSINPGETYFPEGLFAQWYKREKGEDISVYCYQKIGVLPLIECFNIIKKRHGIDSVIVMDGGVDGIFRGDEYELGTPSMDSISMIAANECDIERKYYCMTAFGSEGVGREVSHAEVLNRISDLIKVNAYYGVSALVRANEDIDNGVNGFASELISASRYIFDRMPPYQHSNIVCSILKSIEGCFGDIAVNVKTQMNPIWVSALTSLYWFFDLNRTARQKLFYENCCKSESVEEVARAIENFRSARSFIKPKIPI